MSFTGNLQLAHVVAPIIGALGMLAWRVRETRVPVTERAIILPPLAMSTGFVMFALPMFRMPLWWAVTAFAAGALLFAIPLARSSRLVRQGDVILLQRSRAFLAILLGLAAVRFALRGWIDHYISAEQTASLLFVLAFGMILRWRLGMLAAWRRL